MKEEFNKTMENLREKKKQKPLEIKISLNQIRKYRRKLYFLYRK
jgi:hypothetical protein